MKKYLIAAWCTIFVVIGFVYFSGRRDTDKMTKTVNDNSVHLIAAINKYKFDNGIYPIGLGLLIPKYLDEIPETGLDGFDKFTIKTGDQAKNIYGADWALVVPVPRGFLNWDDIAYINGKWRYIHE